MFIVGICLQLLEGILKRVLEGTTWKNHCSNKIKKSPRLGG